MNSVLNYTTYKEQSICVDGDSLDHQLVRTFQKFLSSDNPSIIHQNVYFSNLFLHRLSSFVDLIVVGQVDCVGFCLKMLDSVGKKRRGLKSSQRHSEQTLRRTLSSTGNLKFFFSFVHLTRASPNFSFFLQNFVFFRLF